MISLSVNKTKYDSAIAGILPPFCEYIYKYNYNYYIKEFEDMLNVIICY